MHGAENRAYRSQPGDARADERQQSEHQHRYAAVSEQQQDHHADDVEAADPLRLALSALLHEHGKRTGPARLEPQVAVGARSLERTLQHIGGLALALRVESRGPRLGDEQGLVPRSAEPDVVEELRLPCRQPRVGEFQQLECRVTRQPGFQQPRCWGGEVTYTLLELCPEESGIQCRVVQRGRQQVPIGQQRIRNRVQVRLAVRDQTKLAACAQRGRQRP